jgi:hypothetical protein
MCAACCRRRNEKAEISDSKLPLKWVRQGRRATTEEAKRTLGKNRPLRGGKFYQIDQLARLQINRNRNRRHQMGSELADSAIRRRAIGWRFGILTGATMAADAARHRDRPAGMNGNDDAGPEEPESGQKDARPAIFHG